MNMCPNCNNEIKSKWAKKFCSRSCAATYTNKVPKRKRKIWYCQICKAETSKRRAYCETCFSEGFLGDLTLKEAIYEYHHRSSAYALVRSRARKLTKNWHKICGKCGYSKHVETCHIKSIGEYPDDTKLSVINSPENLILLCPNCHWEFDHSMLKIE